uniref:Autophagy-related protein 3 n=1 Tax=Oryza glumipatula TaxID=40148 RepID=A0A0D9Y4U8_9ORYZ
MEAGDGGDRGRGESKPSPASSRMQVKQKVYELYKGTVERVTGPRTVSAFLDKGVLSVPEFILAGDNLVSKCPTWSCSLLPSVAPPQLLGLGLGGVSSIPLCREAGDPSKRKPYLPPDKQFLVTRNVPCLRRAVSLEEEYDAAGAEVVLGDDEDGEGWLATHGVQASKQEEEEDIPSMDTLDIGKTEGIKSIPSYFSAGKKAEEEEEDIPDMDTYEDSGNDSVATAQPSYFVAEEPEDDNILRTRTYDVSITYDKYYQTPRVWLTGYDESRMPLKPELVTIEDHPHLSAGKHASVHPCKHAAVMKKIIDVLMSRGVEPEVDNLWPQSYPLLNMTTLWTSIWAAQADDLLIEGKGKIL